MKREQDRQRYAAGFAAGERWAVELATWDDLEAVGPEQRIVGSYNRPFVRGLLDGAASMTELVGALLACQFVLRHGANSLVRLALLPRSALAALRHLVRFGLRRQASG